jgi:broad specificity phosphatase PhoE
MSVLHFITHPQAVVDPAVPVPQWSLSEAGRRRVEVFAKDPVLGNVGSIWFSDENKAQEAAKILAARLGVSVSLLPALGENDRRSTGFLAPDRFEAAADAFFAAPEKSYRGWERAIDAQRRILGAFEAVLAAPRDPGSDVIVVSHGAVGTLLKCHLRGRQITPEGFHRGNSGSKLAKARVMGVMD